MNASSRNVTTYVAEMCSRPTRQTMRKPRSQITAIGATTLPHWILKCDTVSGARKSTALKPKFDGFQRCRSRSRSTYFDEIEIRLHSPYGQKNGERTRMPT